MICNQKLWCGHLFRICSIFFAQFNRYKHCPNTSSLLIFFCCFSSLNLMLVIGIDAWSLLANMSIRKKQKLHILCVWKSIKAAYIAQTSSVHRVNFKYQNQSPAPSSKMNTAEEHQLKAFFQNFKILGKLGEGSYGVVVQAEHYTAGKCAIKLSDKDKVSLKHEYEIYNHIEASMTGPS